MTATPSSHVVAVPDPAELLEVAMKVAERAADLLVTAAGTERTSIESKSSRTDMVTEVDRASEELVVAELAAARPDDGILAEEGSSRPSSSGVRWVIDPLDGTTNFLYGFGSWAVSIAAEQVGGPGEPGDGPGGSVDRVLAGVVVDVPRGEVFGAAKGSGAHCNGWPIRCSDTSQLATALVATGFGYDAARRREQADVLRTVLPEVRDIRRAGAAALDLCSVACGRCDAYYERGLAWWDHAAGALIAREAGATVGDLPLGEPDVGTVMATSPGLHAALRELLATAGA